MGRVLRTQIENLKKKYLNHLVLVMYSPGDVVCLVAVRTRDLDHSG